MPVTTARSIWFPDATAPVSPLENLFSQQATSVDTAITSLAQTTITAQATQAARDLLFPSPVQGNAVYRTDLGWFEMYRGAYNASTNPGGARVAGWYPMDGQGPTISALPTAASPGTSPGRIGWATPTKNLGFTFSTSNGAMTIPYEGEYEMILQIGISGSGQVVTSYLRDSSGTGVVMAAQGLASAYGAGATQTYLASGQSVSPYVGASVAGTVQADRSFLTVKWAGVRQV